MPIVRSLFGPIFILAGVNHFVSPRFYLRIMPPWLPAHDAVNKVSGIAEIAGGTAITCPDPRVRRFGGLLSIATLIAVFPANVHMALHPEEFPEVPGGATTLYARLPLQAVFVAWALAAMRPPARPRLTRRRGSRVDVDRHREHSAGLSRDVPSGWG